MSFFAARTERLHFGTHVYNIGLRHPFLTAARAAATVDVLSGGRLELGIGAGWLRAGSGMPWASTSTPAAHGWTRPSRSAARLWTEDAVEYHGIFFDFGPVTFEPKPVQALGPALQIGGDGPAAFRRAATVGAGWMPMNHTLEQVPASLARIHEIAERHGRTEPVQVTLFGDVTKPEDVEPLVAAGVTRIMVRPWTRTRRRPWKSMQRFADQVIQRL